MTTNCKGVIAVEIILLVYLSINSYTAVEYFLHFCKIVEAQGAYNSNVFGLCVYMSVCLSVSTHLSRNISVSVYVSNCLSVYLL